MKQTILALALMTVGCGRMDEGTSTLSAAEPPDFERDDIALAIPDQGGPQLVYPMAIDSTGLVGGLGIQIRVRHTYIGDLLIFLEDPTGERILLHNREGAGMQNIDKTYGTGGVEINLDAIMLHEVNGTWKLIIDDEAREDTGTLQYVKMTILKV